MRPLVAACVLLLQAAVSPRPAALQGHVVRAGSRAPVPHATVVAAMVGGQHTDYRTAVTDAQGAFSVPAIAPGTYRIHATREGFLRGEFGRRGVGASGVPVVVGEGQTFADLEIVLTPTGAIAGRVIDQGGRPVRDAWVRALKPRFIDGRRSLDAAEWAQTDDRGEYRLFGLAPGFYVVNAVPRERARIEGGQLVTPQVPTNTNSNRPSASSALSVESIQAAAFDRSAYPPVYHPGTIDAASAQPLEVRAGETTSGIDLAIQPGATFHVRGYVTAIGAGSSPEVTVSLAPVEGVGFLRIPSPSVESGSFDFPSVPTGRYFLFAQTKVPPGPLMRRADQVDVVDRDVEVAPISLEPGVTVTGRLTIEGRPPPPNRPMTSLQLRSEVGFLNYSTIRFEPDGTFAIENVLPREYRFQALAGRTIWVKSARYGEQDALSGLVRIAADQQGRVLEVDLGERPPTLDAIVLDDERRPVAGVLVVAVPDVARRNQSQAYRSATTGSDGRARLEGVVPGEYTIFATESIEAADWQDPAVLQRQEGRGTVVRIRDGQPTPSVTVRITS